MRHMYSNCRLRFRLRGMALLASLAIAVAGIAGAKSPDAELVDRLSTAFSEDLGVMMPSWGRPLTEKPIRALLIAPRHTLYDAAALSHHLDIELDERTCEPFSGHTHAYTFNRRAWRDALALLENSQMAGLKPVSQV